MAQLKGIINAGNFTFTGTGRIFNGNTGVSSFLIPGGLDLMLVGSNTVLGKGASGNIAALNTLPAVSGVNLTALNATQLTSGTIPDARYGATLPAVSGVNLTALNAAQLTSGTIPGARLPNPLPVLGGELLTNLNASNLDPATTIPDINFPSTLPAGVGINCSVNLTAGTIPGARLPNPLPAISGVNLTGLDATMLTVGTIPDDRFPSTLPSTVQIDCSTNLTSGTIPDDRFPLILPAVSGENLTDVSISIITGLGANVAAWLAVPSSANLRTLMTDESGAGALLFAGGALGTPAAGSILTNCTGLPVSAGISGLGTGVASFLADPTSAKFRTMVTDESGTGALLFAGGALGTPLSGTLTNCTGPNLLGHITSVGNTTSLGSFTLAQLSTAVSDAVVARTDAGQTFVGDQTVTGNLTANGTTQIINATATWKIGDVEGFGATIEGDATTGDIGVSCAEFSISGTFVAARIINTSVIPTQNSQSGNYTLVLTDADCDILHPASSGPGDVFTIPANSSVAFEVGTPVRFINRDASNSLTIAINTDILTMSPSGATGSRTLAPFGIASARKITATEWMISGTGLT